MLWLGVQLFLLFIGVVVAGAREEKRLNVLLIVVDDLRPEFNVSYGQTHLVTPVLDTFAKDSLTFNRAYTQYVPILPSSLQQWIGTPCVLVLDCSNAARIVEALGTMLNTPGLNGEGWVRVRAG